MKKIIYSLFICLAFVLSSCEDETSQDTSKITYFVDLEVYGDAQMFWEKGIPFEEPGYSAILDGEDVTGDVKITTNLNIDKGGIYNIKYSAVNEDGFAKEFTRIVYVYDTTESPIESGFFTVTKDSYRNSSGTIVAYGNSYPIVIIQEEPGKFYVSDFFGGWYDKRAGYGSVYTMPGYFKLNADNSIELISSQMIGGWGDSLDGMNAGKYDPATNSIYWEAGYAGSMSFNVTLTK
ncbi:DUF5012 domain-containing protein [Parabacteroides sp. OttesenSCG-928-G07]|nr:DUF5012 domain-containing protein [Parabacteroides sp. OttesenSCG-928-G07]